MNKIEYSAIYKFLTSLGLILFALAFIIPWFLLKKTFYLDIEQETINKLTPVAQKIILEQQNILLYLNLIIPIISLLLLTLGIIFFVFGIYKWNKRQKVLDALQDEDLKSKKIHNATENEKMNEIKKEIDEYNRISENKNINQKEINYKVNSYLNIENKVSSLIFKKYSKNYHIINNAKIDNYFYDLILEPNQYSKYHKLIEIKYYTRTIKYIQIKDFVSQFLLKIQYYKEKFSRNIYSYLIIVYNKVETDINLKNYIETAVLYAREKGFNLKIIFAKENMLEHLDLDNILNDLN